MSDPSQFSSLRDWLHGQGIDAVVTPRTPEPGELGSLDVLVVLASSTGVVSAVKTLPDFIRSRRAGFRIETTVNGKPFVLEASNVDEKSSKIVEEISKILERPLDE
ncbi:hypothetical protein [Streptomyces sp. NPDC056304]|uniref:effector-associated constant component EACC1 n=1 Tax=Streptomyces sp. NPDC056304 TaxID=3345778 RepID=UPI0035D71193